MNPPRPHGYRTLLFDLDNTLFDFRASERLAFAACADAAGMPAGPEVFARYKEINDALWAAVERGEITPRDAGRQRFVTLLEEFPGHDDAEPDALGERFQLELGAQGDLYVGVAELLDELSARVELALITNGLTAVQRAKTERLGLDRWFPAIVISDEVGVAKPDPAIFDVAFHALDEALGPRQRRDEALMIGDSLTSDIAGGHAAGVATAWYAPQFADATSPADPRVDHVLGALDEVRRLID